MGRIIFMKNNITIAIMLASLTGCGSQMDELKNVGRQPPLQKVEIPMEKSNYEPLDWEYSQPKGQSYSNSLWQQGSREFFKDMRARRVGDVLKVTVKIKDKAELDNETKRSRQNAENASANKIFGLEEKIVGMLPGVANPAALLDLEGASNTTGKGNIAREEKIETEVAAMVTQILPNGNLVIHGDQEIGVNFEVRKITVDGIIRPEDISADNTIDSTQIAEARISYGGRGQITNIQQPRLGNQVIDILSPF